MSSYQQAQNFQLLSQLSISLVSLQPQEAQLELKSTPLRHFEINAKAGERPSEVRMTIKLLYCSIA